MKVRLPTCPPTEGTLFLLEVVGDSMINAAIADGDWVVVRQQEEAQDGDVVAARSIVGRRGRGTRRV